MSSNEKRMMNIYSSRGARICDQKNKMDIRISLF